MYYVQTLAIHAFVVPFYAACWLATEKVQQSFNSSLMVSVTHFLRNVRATPANSTTPTEHFSHKKTLPGQGNWDQLPAGTSRSE